MATAVVTVLEGYIYVGEVTFNERSLDEGGKYRLQSLKSQPNASRKIPMDAASG